MSTSTKGTDVIDQGESGRVELSIPAQPFLLQLVRLTAGVVAARAELGLDDVEDLRLAVDELCLPFMGPTGHAGRLLLQYRWDTEVIEISCVLSEGEDGLESGQSGVRALPEHQIRGQAQRLRDELSSQILDALVDAHGETTIDGRAAVWLRMRRRREVDRDQ